MRYEPAGMCVYNSCIFVLNLYVINLSGEVFGGFVGVSVWRHAAEFLIDKNRSNRWSKLTELENMLHWAACLSCRTAYTFYLYLQNSSSRLDLYLVKSDTKQTNFTGFHFARLFSNWVFWDNWEVYLVTYISVREECLKLENVFERLVY